MNWMDASELVFGLVLQKRINSVPSPEFFHEPYNKAIYDIKTNNSSPESLVKTYGAGVIMSAHERANELNGLGDIDWVDILQHSYEQWVQADLHAQFERSLRMGEDVDLSPLRQYINGNGNHSGKLIRGSDVTAMDIPLIKSGYKPIDFYLGGIPASGLVTILAYTKTGKTSFAITLMDKFLKQYPSKVALYVSTEMTDGEIKMRATELGAIENFDRVFIVEHSGNVDSIFHFSDGIENLGMVIIDILDDLAGRAISEPEMSYIYQTLAQIARKHRIPLIATCQPHGNAGKTLRPNNARWSRMAEARTYLFLSLYNPSKTYARAQEDDISLPRRRGTAWILCWLCRGGPRINDYKDLFPFAIPVPYLRNGGWGDAVHEKAPPISLDQLKEAF